MFKNTKFKLISILFLTAIICIYPCICNAQIHFGRTQFLKSKIKKLKEIKTNQKLTENTTAALRLAEMGIDEAVSEINQSSDGWNAIIKGIFPPFYDGITVFTETNEGSYKVKISSAREGIDDLVIIQSVATDINGRALCGIKAIYSKTLLGGVFFGRSYDIHWGRMMNPDGNITMNNPYPRKYAGLGYYVDGRDPDGIGGVNIGPDNGADARNQPLDNEYKDWSSNNYRAVPEVEVNLSSYAARAKAYTTPANAPNRANADPPNSGYYPASVCPVSFPNGYLDNNADAVYFIECDAEFGAQAFIGPSNGLNLNNHVALICLGNLALPAVGGSPTPYNVYVPPNAWKEYQVIDTATSWEYPADTGFRSHSLTCDVQATGAGETFFHGFLYVGGNLEQGTGNKKAAGVFIVKGLSLLQGGTFILFYDKVVDQNILFSNQTFSRDYLTEFLPGSFNNPTW